MRKVAWTDSAWSEYLWWDRNDKRTRDRINILVESVATDPFRGIGKPEALRQNLRGYWSRRITAEHRLVYRVEADKVIVVQCRFHY